MIKRHQGEPPARQDRQALRGTWMQDDLRSSPVFACSEIADDLEQGVAVVRAVKLIVEVPATEYTLDLHRLAIKHRAFLETVLTERWQQIQNLAGPGAVCSGITMAIL